jgi:AGZA family xanthine/uracil permease-like MFS transporter
MLLMPLTYSVSNGIMLGIISYTFIHALIGKIKEVHWLMIVLSFVFILKYALM